ncbi:ArgS-related anticodon-binding protein NrtL [Streptomyces sp. NPDC029526]|uniref:ArgS-related anticodon-binding protein NrtL n=1 Tax=Streptomyces sp. NPDC029526 TaxID=3155728 RepID=UPI0033F3A138
MTPVELSRTVLRAVRRAVEEGELEVAVPERVVVAPPGGGGCGDYATGVALQLARPAGETPQRVARILRAHLLRQSGIREVAVTGPGFLNISLGGSAAVALVAEILAAGARYGESDALRGQVVRLGAPVEMRAVVQGEVLVRVLRSQGADARLVHLTHLTPRAQTSRPAGSSGREAGGEAVRLPREWSAVLGVPSVLPAPGADVSALAPVPVPAPADVLALGRDAARWALLYPAPHDRPVMPGVHLLQRESNPLFRVRYAHARVRALLRNAADLGYGSEPGEAVRQAPAERTLLALLGDHPRVLAAVAAQRTPDRLARQLVAVADAVMPLLPAVLPLGEEKPSAAHRARLALAEAAGAVLAGGLDLLGIDAPDHL